MMSRSSLMGCVRSALGLLAIVGLGQCSQGSPSVPSATPSPTRSSSTVSSCPKPTDNEGRPLYETIHGAFVERRIDQGGGYSIVMEPTAAAANQAVVITREVYDAVGGVER